MALIVHNRKVTARSVAQPDTSGFMRKTARRTVAQATAITHTRAGKHNGGPCAAVCIATLAGWSYGQAASALRKHGRFNGSGATVAQIVGTMRDVFGAVQTFTALHSTVAQAAARHFKPGQCGAVLAPRHIMPVVDGKLLNAVGYDHQTCTDVILLPELKVKR